MGVRVSVGVGGSVGVKVTVGRRVSVEVGVGVRVSVGEAVNVGAGKGVGVSVSSGGRVGGEVGLRAGMGAKGPAQTMPVKATIASGNKSRENGFKSRFITNVLLENLSAESTNGH